MIAIILWYIVISIITFATAPEIATTVTITAGTIIILPIAALYIWTLLEPAPKRETPPDPDRRQRRYIESEIDAWERKHHRTHPMRLNRRNNLQTR